MLFLCSGSARKIVSRRGYLCRVAAINAAGEVGPATADAVSLTLPPLGRQH